MAEAEADATMAIVMEIAFQLGFSDSSSFRRVFKRWTGSSPVEYKQQKR